MLSRKFRVSKDDFKELKNKGRTYYGDLISLRIIQLKKETPEKKFTFVASKKVSKNASDRNLLKRRGRAVVQKHLHSIQSGNYYFFYFKKTPEIPSFHNMETEIVFLLKKSGKFKKI